MDALANPPRDARLEESVDGLTVHLSPWLVDHGRHDETALSAFGVIGGALGHRLTTGPVRLGGVLLVGMWFVLDALAGFTTSCGLTALGIVGTLGWLGVASWRDQARARQALKLVITRHALRVEWHSGDDLQRQERVALSDIGKVETRSAGYQRKHVVAHVHGRDPLVIPVERESDEVAAWLTELLAGLGRRSRAQDGAPWDIPSELRALTERE